MDKRGFQGSNMETIDQGTSVSNDRHTVKHVYHDHAFDDPNTTKSKKQRRGPRGGVTTPFPVKLHNLLEENSYEDIISWQPHGRCFVLRDPKRFLQLVMPKYFKQTKLTSFQRQLNLYGFNRLTSGHDKGGYYHELFLRGKAELCSGMIRMRIKGTRTKGASDPDSEPNFYRMPPLSMNKPSSPNVTDDETMSTGSTETHTSAIKNEQQGDKVCSNDSHNTSPNNVSDLNQISSSAKRSISPLTGAHIGLPIIPFGTPIGVQSTSTITPRINPSHVANAPTQFYPAPPAPQPPQFLSSISTRLPDTLLQPDTLTFEGKEFHYLDSRTLDEDIASSFDTNGTYDVQSGLTVDTDGRMYGFDLP